MLRTIRHGSLQRLASIKESCIQEVRLRARIEEVIAPFVQLRRAGSQLKGLCPFHREKSPSFHVSPDKGYFKCFGCGKSGDAFGFLMELEQRDFPETVEVLARRFGVPVDYEEGRGPDANSRSLRQQLFELHEAAAQFFRDQMLAQDETGAFARDYWVNRRRFPSDLAEEFRIGFAPANDFALATRLLKTAAFPDEALRQCGIFYEREGQRGAARWRCRFRGRLMIPIRDVQDRIVAFTARVTELTPEDDPSREAKYINSPETDIFKKSHLLFNLGRARTGVRDGTPFLLVEGQLDALRCWHSGLRTAVAPQGTAITEQQLHLLHRHNPRIECFLDGDLAGQKAALRMLPLALRAGLEVTFLPLEPGQDPDSYFLKEGAGGLAPLRARGRPAMHFACERLLPEGARAGAEAKDRAAEALFEIVASADSQVLQAACLRTIAGHLGISPGAVAETFNRFLAKRPRRTAEAAGDLAADALGPRVERAVGNPSVEPVPRPAVGDVGHAGRPEEDYLLSVLLQSPEHQQEVAQLIPQDWLNLGSPGGALLDRLLNEILHGLWAEGDTIDRLLTSPEERDFAAKLLFDVPKPEFPGELLNQQIAQLARRSLQPRIQALDRSIAAGGSPAELAELFNAKKQLLAKLRNPPTLNRFS